MTKAIIMAGGAGTRLRPLTSNRPKPMIPVINKPVIEHAINLLKKHGIKDIVLSLFYLPENIQNYFGDGSDWDVNITYSVEETPLGTAGGVKQAIGDYKGSFIVLSGDGIIDFDITDILKYHKEKSSPFTIVLKRVNKPTEYGIVITNEDGKIEKFLEKPAWSEVFSDTANTGMYVINSDLIDEHIPENENFDFSLDLFPILQKNNIPLFGYISDGYWCDVGNISTFRDVHTDILDGIVDIDIPGKKIAHNVWIGKEVEIHPDAKITGPVVIGNFVRIKKGAEISEFSVIGDSCIIEENASIKKTIILNSTIIGPKCEMRGVLIGKRCIIEENVSANEGSVISDDCTIGIGSIIPANIRVWPNKTLEPGTKLASDLIWAQSEKKTLFGTDGIIGTFNVKITPEFAAKLGSAIGAYLGKNNSIVIGRDTTPAARLIKRSITAGLLSMGVDTYDMEVESVPINKYSTKYLNSDMGIYIQMAPLTGMQYLQIKLFDRHGYQISLDQEKKIENIFFRGDYPRKDAFETGRIIYPTHHTESYISNTENYINIKLLKEKKWNITVDCFNGTASPIFPRLLNNYGIETTVLRGQVKEFQSKDDARLETKKAFRQIIKMSKINKEIGLIIGLHGNHLSIIDETGNILSDDDVSSILTLYHLKYNKNKTINIRMNTSQVMENLITTNNGKAIRTSSKLRSPENTPDIFGNSKLGVFPKLQIEYDPMISFLLILEYLTLEDATLSETKNHLPTSNMVNRTINCTIDEKAAIMRILSESIDDDKIELKDGIKISNKDAWILILPDAIHPTIHIFGEGSNETTRDDIIKKYKKKIKTFLNERIK